MQVINAGHKCRSAINKDSYLNSETGLWRFRALFCAAPDSERRIGTRQGRRWPGKSIPSEYPDPIGFYVYESRVLSTVFILDNRSAFLTVSVFFFWESVYTKKQNKKRRRKNA